MTSDGGVPPASPDLQFDKAEFAAGPATRICQRCQRPINDEYFEAGGQAVCRPCSEEIAGTRGGSAPFWRALAFGGGAALVGTIVWFIILKLTESEWGLVAIFVGLGVGFAVRKGSGGRGGWKYQALAMALTYASITASYVPIVIKGFTDATEQKEKEQAGAPGGAEKLAAEKAAAQSNVTAGKAVGALILFLVVCFGFALVAPFLAGAQNIIGILIIGFALYEAWKLNKKVTLTGPFRLAPPAPASEPVAGAG